MTCVSLCRALSHTERQWIEVFFTERKLMLTHGLQTVYRHEQMWRGGTSWNENERNEKMWQYKASWGPVHTKPGLPGWSGVVENTAKTSWSMRIKWQKTEDELQLAIFRLLNDFSTIWNHCYHSTQTGLIRIAHFAITVACVKLPFWNSL